MGGNKSTIFTKTQIQSHLVSLYRLAKVDNRYRKEEELFLYELAARYEIEKKQLTELLQSNDLPPFTPSTLSEKIFCLYNYILMMLVDGRLDDREARMCSIIADRMDLPKQLVGSMSNALASRVDEGQELLLSEEEFKLFRNYTLELL
jgi:hypothetical protein